MKIQYSKVFQVLSGISHKKSKSECIAELNDIQHANLIVVSGIEDVISLLNGDKHEHRVPSQVTVAWP